MNFDAFSLTRQKPLKKILGLDVTGRKQIQIQILGKTSIIWTGIFEGPEGSGAAKSEPVGRRRREEEEKASGLKSNNPIR